MSLFSSEFVSFKWPVELVNKMEKRKEARKKLPEALSKQKKKLLIALNKNSDGDDFSNEDNEFVNKVMHDFSPSQCVGGRYYLSFLWDDSKAVNIVNITLEKHGLFDLPSYLDCAKIIFITYSGSGAYITQFAKAAEYVLTHARRFGDPSKVIFENDGKHTPLQILDLVSQPLPDSKFMNKIKELVQDLQFTFDETKYMILNLNTTYITLLMLRRIVKKESALSNALKLIQTHDTYVKLCPWPLDNQLPKCDTSKLDQARSQLTYCAYLVVHAYLNTEDEMTKRVLRVTCIQYMEWNGLHLPSLFFKVVDLYQIDAGKLWDLLSLDITAVSLVRLADDYYKQYQLLKKDPSKTQHWFPYCRVLEGDYHRDLSASVNNIICIVLAYLVDLKIGYDKSAVRLSHWAQSNYLYKEKCEHFATELHKKIIGDN